LCVGGLLALELLGGIGTGSVDAGTVPEAAHLARNGLLVGLHDAVVDVGAIGALAGEVEGRRIAVVAVVPDLALATTDVDASVLVGGAPVRTLVLRNIADGDRAARNGRVKGGVLGRREACEGRDGDKDGGVAHG